MFRLFAGSIFLCAAPAFSGYAQTTEPYTVNVNSQGVILDGYDAVSLRDGQPARGQKAYSVQYHGATYWFANEKNKKRFEANPARFEPEFGGYCAYGVATGSLVGIEISTYDTSFENRNIYNYNKSIARKWKKDPAGWYKKALKNWPKLAAQQQKK
jgi:YHS domain-containing protein